MTAAVDRFWSSVAALYTEWENQPAWGDILLIVAGKPVDESFNSAVDKLYTTLFEAYMANTPLYLTRSKTIGLFINSSSAAAVEVVQPFLDSSPRTIKNSTYTFVLHDKNRKEVDKDVKVITNLLSQGQLKTCGLVFDEEYIFQYSFEFVNQIRQFCLAAQINTVNINGPMLKIVEKISTNSDQQDEDDEESSEDEDQPKVNSALSERRQRARNTKASSYTIEEERYHRNKGLAEIRAQQALITLQTDSSLLNEFKDPSQRVVTAYKSLSEVPNDLNPRIITLDTARDTILFPINSILVPFHISCVKNVNKEELGEFFVLTVEFVTPTAKKYPPGSTPEHIFIRSLQYRCKGGSLSDIFTKIRALQSEYKNKLKAATSVQQIVDLPKLILNKSSTIQLRDVHSFPPILPAKGAKGRPIGHLTAHANGFKYIVSAAGNSGGAYLDIIYSNIKGCFLQRADGMSNKIIIHFELEHPILIKNDKTSKFIQFFIELSTETHDVSHSNMNDREAELLEEEEERKERQRRKQGNDRFATFASDVEAYWEKNNQDLAVTFELPKKGFKFTGMIHRDIYDVYPTDSHIIALESTPTPFVVSVADIEVVSIERVGIGLREFDLVFVFKQFRQDPKMIASIPAPQLELVRRWLGDNGILYIESKINIVWKQLIDDIKQDILGFYETGGWGEFFRQEDEDEDEDEDAEIDENGEPRRSKRAAYEDSDSDFEADDDDASSSDDDFTSDSEFSEEDDNDGSGLDDLSDGEDWSDLEEDALEEDRRSEKTRDHSSSKKDKKDSKKDKKR